MKNKILILALMLIVAEHFTYSKDIVIAGSVVDSLSSKGISSVNVFVKDTRVGTTTDEEGKFLFHINLLPSNPKLIVSHIAYRQKTIDLSTFKNGSKILLMYKDIHLGEVQVEGTKRAFDYQQEIRNIISRIPAETFELKGYTDAADVIASDQSTFLDESFSGKKIVSIRGSNDYEVSVLYDGVKINNSFDNVFDLSLIDPSSLEQIDIIKGSNASAFSSFGSAATINLIPKDEQDYFVRFQQRIGTYDSGDWGLNLYKNLWGLKTFSSFKRGGATRQYIDIDNNNTDILTFTKSDMLNLSYGFGERDNSSEKHTIHYKLLDSYRDFDNPKFLEYLEVCDRVNTVAYTGDFEQFGEFKIHLSQNEMKEDHSWEYLYSLKNKKIDDRSVLLSINHTIKFKDLSIFLNYQHDASNLKYKSEFLSTDNITTTSLKQKYDRTRDGFSNSIQFLNNTNKDNFSITDVSFSLCFESVTDLLPPTFNPDENSYINKSWNENSYFLSVKFDSPISIFFLKGYLNYGLSYSIPTMYQQLSSQLYRFDSNRPSRLMSEHKRNMEFGLCLTNNHSSSHLRYSLTSALFRNSYTDKFRTIYVSSSPITFFDNHAKTAIVGTENTATLYIFRNILRFDLSFSKYFTSDVIAFPFMPSRKISSKISVNVMGFNAEIVLFHETKRVGSVLHLYEGMEELTLPEFSNVDLHIKQSIKIWNQTIFASFSGRNIFSKEPALEGIAIRDKRIYLTAGLELR